MSTATSRRSLLGALAAAPLVAAPAIPALPAHWQQAKAAFIAARDAENLYDRTVAWPAWDAAPKGKNGGYIQGPEVDAISAVSDRLCDERCAAEERVIAAPAPDLAAVIWKITYARERWTDFEDWPAAWWDAITADLRRLSGELA